MLGADSGEVRDIIIAPALTEEEAVVMLEALRDSHEDSHQADNNTPQLQSAPRMLTARATSKRIRTSDDDNATI